MGEIIPIVSQTAAEAAWEEYRSGSVKIIDDPKLLLDRQFMEDHRRAERKWQRLFDRMDG